MPVKKTATMSSPESIMPDHHGHHGACLGRHVPSSGKKLMFTLFGIFIAYSIVLLGTLIRNNLRKYDFIGRADTNEHTLVVEAEGKITVTPDIAMTSMGMVADGKTVAAAQQKNTEVMNKLTDRLKQLGIDGKDIQTTNYNIYPQYDYTSTNGQVVRGYQVTQSITVKIRDVAKASQVIALAGEVGANNVGGLQFTVDDPEVYKTKARELALKKVGQKAAALSRSLGVRVIGITAYNEYEGQGGKSMYGANMNLSQEMGVGGAASSPTIETGTNDVVMNVSVVFQIR